MKSIGWSAAEAETRGLLTEGGPPVVFEALIAADPLVTRPDILVRDGDGWRLLEVKSSVDLKPALIDDLAYTRLTLSRAGMKVTDSALLLLSRDYRKGAPVEQMFVLEQPALKIEDAVIQLEAEVDEVCSMLLADDPPPAVPCRACRDCVLELDDCPVRLLNHPVYELPRLRNDKIKRLVDDGVLEVADSPDDFPLSGEQELVRDTVVQGKAWVSNGLGGELAKVQWPAYYLDFETFSVPFPLFDDVGPWTQVPTQFSVHVSDRPGHIAQHHEFLADPSEDPRRPLAQELVRVIGTEGSVIVYYAPFERGVLSDLQKWIPDLSTHLHAIQERLVDLCEVVKTGYRHPDFRGSLSIKKTLPVMVPEMTYDSLDIADGDAASAVFALMALGYYEKEQWPRLRADLLEYCGQDTLGMVRMHEALYRVVGK